MHVPYCRQRCVYCDFYFVTGKRDHGPFVRALCQELRAEARARPATSLSTLYLGGGTPSRLTIPELSTMLSAVHESFDTSALGEVTIEANPDDITASYLQDLKGLGINRLSVGVQSFFEDELQFMNRSHDAAQARESLALIAEAGLVSFTVDLIFGLPGQPVERWAQSLNELRAYQPPHVSTYALTIEERTPLHKQVARSQVTPARDEEVARHYQVAMDTLRSWGMEHYEISSFALPEHRAAHNQQYWTHANYLGLGPSGHSFWWDRSAPAERWSNVRSLSHYVRQLSAGESVRAMHESLTPTMLATERVMLGLRTMEGVDLAVLKRTYGYDLEGERQEALRGLVAQNLIEYVDGKIRLTDPGKHVCDSVTRQLLP